MAEAPQMRNILLPNWLAGICETGGHWRPFRLQQILPTSHRSATTDSYEEVFSRQIEAIGNKGDLAIGISTSGNSKNVLRAVSAATKKGLITVGMTGSNGGELRHRSDYCLCVPSKQTPRIQEAHILLGHTLCEIIEEHFSQ